MSTRSASAATRAVSKLTAGGVGLDQGRRLGRAALPPRGEAALRVEVEEQRPAALGLGGGAHVDGAGGLAGAAFAGQQRDCFHASMHTASASGIQTMHELMHYPCDNELLPRLIAARM